MGDSEIDTQSPESLKPLLFISHKHADALIAQEVARFVRRVTGGGVDVFVSSDPKYEGPRVGKALNEELKYALWRAGVVLLIYTSQDNDWSWCMWECGIAIEPNSPDTKVVVLQCLKDEPQVFTGSVRILAWEKDSIQAFAKRFLDVDFFPGLGRRLTGLSLGELSDAAEDLYAALDNTIPQEPAENWATWPCMRLRLETEVIEELKAVSREERIAKTRQALLEKAAIILSLSGSPDLFGRTELPSGMLFGQLVKDWRDDFPNRPDGWLDVIARQLVDGARKRRPMVSEWERFRDVGSDDESVPVVGQVKSDAEAMSFDLYFCGVAHQVPLVTSRMNPPDRMYYLDLARKPAQEVNLRELLGDLEDRDWNRIPVLDGQFAKYIVHVSMVDRFLRTQAYAGQDIAQLTLHDLLSDAAMERMFAETWGVVAAAATVGDAQKAMRSVKRCQDLFVTEGGARNEPVLGWLTDRDIAGVIT